MLETQLRDLFERQAAADQPPARVNIARACAQGRAKLRRRRAGLAGSPVVVAGVVTVIALTAGPVPGRPHAHPSAGPSPAAARR